MDIASAREGADTVVFLSGDLDISSADQVEQSLTAEIERTDSGRVIVDIQNVPFADSSGLGGLISAYKKAKAKGREVRLRKPSPIMSEILTITRMNRFFAIEN